MLENIVYCDKCGGAGEIGIANYGRFALEPVTIVPCPNRCIDGEIPLEEL